MKKFAYLDNAEILHITKGINYAERDVKKEYDANGKVIKVWPIVETDFPAKGGYPVDHGGNAYILYSETLDAHQKQIPQELTDLYKSVK